MTRSAIALILVGAGSGALAQERQDFNTRCDLVAADSCQWGNLKNRNLDGKDLSDSNYKAVHLQGASLRDATLERINLQVSDVSGADFSRANWPMRRFSRLMPKAPIFPLRSSMASISPARISLRQSARRQYRRVHLVRRRATRRRRVDRRTQMRGKLSRQMRLSDAPQVIVR